MMPVATSTPDSLPDSLSEPLSETIAHCYIDLGHCLDVALHSPEQWRNYLHSDIGLFHQHVAAPPSVAGLHLTDDLELAGERLDAEIGFFTFHDPPYDQEEFFQGLVASNGLRAHQYILGIIGLGEIWQQRVAAVREVYELLGNGRRFLETVSQLSPDQRVYSPSIPSFFAGHPYLNQTFPLDYRFNNGHDFQRALRKSNRKEHELTRTQVGLEPLLSVVEKMVEPWIPEE